MSQNGITMMPMMPQFAPNFNKKNKVDEDDKKEIAKTSVGLGATSLVDHGTALAIDALEVATNLAERIGNDGLSRSFQKIIDGLGGLSESVKSYVESNMFVNPGIINLNMLTTNNGSTHLAANTGSKATPTGGRPVANHSSPKR